MLVEVSQPKSHYFVSVTFPIRLANIPSMTSDAFLL